MKALKVILLIVGIIAASQDVASVESVLIALWAFVSIGLVSLRNEIKKNCQMN